MLEMDAGRRAIAEWEADHGPLTAAELAEGLVRARALLGRSTEEITPEGGLLVGDSGRHDVVDVTVVEGALRRGDAVVTSNREHIERVGQAAGITLHIEDV